MFLCFTLATVDTADTLHWTCLLKLSDKMFQSPWDILFWNLPFFCTVQSLDFTSLFLSGLFATAKLEPCFTWSSCFSLDCEAQTFRLLLCTKCFYGLGCKAKKRGVEVWSIFQQNFTTDTRSKLMISKTKPKSL